MSSALKQPMTVEAFLAWEEQQPTTWAFDGVGPVGKIGGTPKHALVQVNLLTALGTRLRGEPYQPPGSDTKILPMEFVRHLNAPVVCTLTVDLPPDTAT